MDLKIIWKNQGEAPIYTEDEICYQTSYIRNANTITVTFRGMTRDGETPPQLWLQFEAHKLLTNIVLTNPEQMLQGIERKTTPHIRNRPKIKKELRMGECHALSHVDWWNHLEHADADSKKGLIAVSSMPVTAGMVGPPDIPLASYLILSRIVNQEDIKGLQLTTPDHPLVNAWKKHRNEIPAGNPSEEDGNQESFRRASKDRLLLSNAHIDAENLHQMLEGIKTHSEKEEYIIPRIGEIIKQAVIAATDPLQGLPDKEDRKALKQELYKIPPSPENHRIPLPSWHLHHKILPNSWVMVEWNMDEKLRKVLNDPDEVRDFKTNLSQNKPCELFQSLATMLIHNKALPEEWLLDEQWLNGAWDKTREKTRLTEEIASHAPYAEAVTSYQNKACDSVSHYLSEKI